MELPKIRRLITDVRVEVDRTHNVLGMQIPYKEPVYETFEELQIFNEETKEWVALPIEHKYLGYAI